MTDTLRTARDASTSTDHRMAVVPDAVAPEPAFVPVAPSTPDLAVRTVTPEALDRVLATAADMVVHGRRVTAHELTRLTGLEPVDVQDCLDGLCARGTLVRAGPEPQHYVFPAGRWPVG